MLLLRSLLLLFLFAAPTSEAQELHRFSNGEVADAEKINDNFQLLDQRIIDVVNESVTFASNGFRVLIADCTTDPDGLERVLTEAKKLPQVKLILSGTCVVDNDSLNFNGGHVIVASQDEFIGGGAECPETAAIISSGNGPGMFVIGIQNSGSLWIQCMSLGGEANPVRLTAYTNGAMRISSGVFAGNADGYNILVRNQSVFRTFDRLDASTIILETGAKANFQSLRGGDAGVSNIILNSGSHFYCQFCGGGGYIAPDGSIPAVIFQNISAQDGSSVTFDRATGPIEVNSLSAARNSHVYVSTLDNGGLNVVNQNVDSSSDVYGLDSPAARASQKGGVAAGSLREIDR